MLNKLFIFIFILLILFFGIYLFTNKKVKSQVNPQPQPVNPQPQPVNPQPQPVNPQPQPVNPQPQPVNPVKTCPPECLHGCNDNGICLIENCKEYNNDMKCSICNDPYYGIDCKQTCNNNETYDGKKCTCISGYIKDKSENCQLIGNCQNGAFSMNGKCLCNSPYYGTRCENTITCPDDSEISISDDFITAYCDCSKTKTCTTNKPCDTSTSEYCKNGGTILYDEKDNTYKCSKCQCSDKYEGLQCQCEKSQNTLTPNVCKGEQVVCQPDGSYKVETVTTTCEDLYKLNGVQDYNQWLIKCSNDKKILSDICSDPKNEYMHNISCNVIDGKVNILCKKECPKEIPDSCNGCKDEGKICNCDSTTEYKYICVDRQNPNDCGKVSNTFCPDSKTPSCAVCGAGGYFENICENNPPSTVCLRKMFTGLTTNKNGIEYNNELPVYPTIDNKLCLKGESPTDYIQKGFTWTGYSRFNNKPGYMVNGNFSSDSEDKRKTIFANDPLKNIKCWWTDEDIVTHLGDSDQSLCRGRGTFKQNGDTQDGICTCNPGFAGKNCQFSDSKDCNGKATVDNNGKCGTCNQRYAGDKCQFSNVKNCRDKGDVDNNGNCKCYMGYIGNICQFSDSSCTKIGLDGKASVDNNNNLICDYSQTCGVQYDRDRFRCRLLVGTLQGNDNEGTVYHLTPTVIDGNHMSILNQSGAYPSNTGFSITNTGGFNGVVFTTRTLLDNNIWNGDNYKINAIQIYSTGDDNLLYRIGIPGTVTEEGPNGGDEARAFTLYIPINQLKSSYWLTSDSKEGGRSKTKLYIYLTMETNEGSWR